MTESRATRLVLVRHAETTWNAEGRIQGRTDTRLSERGRRQAAALGEAVAGLEPTAVVTSPLLRARDTAELLGFPAADADPRWQEADFGEWTGRIGREIARSGDAVPSWREGRTTPPGGESFAALSIRAGEAASALPDAGPGTRLVVTHGGPILAVCCALLGTTPLELAPVGSASLTILERQGGVRLATYNQAPPRS